MKHYTSIPSFYKAVNVPQPKFDHFDTQTLEEHNQNVIRKFGPVKHELYSVAIMEKVSGNINVGNHSVKSSKQYVIFIYSPYQLLSWDVGDEMKGFYILFTDDFIRNSYWGSNFLLNFPFFKIDKSIPFVIEEPEAKRVLSIFNDIYTEYNSETEDKFQLIQAHVFLLLQVVKRNFQKQTFQETELSEVNRMTDLTLVSRFQTFIENQFISVQKNMEKHSVAYYAKALNTHPNHLNAIVKRITGHTAKQVIQQKVLHISKSMLCQSDLTIKEIAFFLGFEEATHFSSFFKKYTQLTPLKFKELNRL